MKATLNFDLDDADDKMAHLRCTKALDLALALLHFDQWLRSQIKYNEKDYQSIRDELYKIMEEYDINLETLTS